MNLRRVWGFLSVNLHVFPFISYILWSNKYVWKADNCWYSPDVEQQQQQQQKHKRLLVSTFAANPQWSSYLCSLTAALFDWQRLITMMALSYWGMYWLPCLLNYKRRQQSPARSYFHEISKHLYFHWGNTHTRKHTHNPTLWVTKH